MRQAELELMAQEMKIQVHDPFADFLLSDSSLHSFEISLLDCFRFAGHACHAMTGAFLVTAEAVKRLWPDTQCCVRGDLFIEFGSALEEMATGPRSNVISFITGSWGETGFPGLRGEFVRKGLVTYGQSELSPRSVRFRRLSTGESVTLEYNPSEILSEAKVESAFPQKWRDEIKVILENSLRAVSVIA